MLNDVQYCIRFTERILGIGKSFTSAQSVPVDKRWIYSRDQPAFCVTALNSPKGETKVKKIEVNKIVLYICNMYPNTTATAILECWAQFNTYTTEETIAVRDRKSKLSSYCLYGVLVHVCHPGHPPHDRLNCARRTNGRVNLMHDEWGMTNEQCSWKFWVAKRKRRQRLLEQHFLKNVSGCLNTSGK